uniref:alpha-N-acetylgalactosaminide alpha-2,6-sialyltransferase 2-like n=1 Tax=Myxine glutinosa TaxID=7769 RepID=UPI00358FF269
MPCPTCKRRCTAKLPIQYMVLIVVSMLVFTIGYISFNILDDSGLLGHWSFRFYRKNSVTEGENSVPILENQKLHSLESKTIQKTVYPKSAIVQQFLTTRNNILQSKIIKPTRLVTIKTTNTSPNIPLKTTKKFPTTTKKTTHKSSPTTIKTTKKFPTTTRKTTHKSSTTTIKTTKTYSPATLKTTKKFPTTTQKSKIKIPALLTTDTTMGVNKVLKVTSERSTTQTPRHVVSTASTTPSWLGDEYGSVTPLYTSSCPYRLQNRLQKLSFPGGKFLVNIPVLMSASDATLANYKRQKYRSPSMGWKNLIFSDINETLSLLKNPENKVLFDVWHGKEWSSEGSSRGAPPSTACVRCAVVGNGGILRGAGQGHNIDAHDYVFRMNGAIIKGYESDVGNRTSFFVVSMNTMFNSLAGYRGQGFRGPPMSNETRYLLLPEANRDYYMVKAAIKHTLVEKGSDKSKNPAALFGENTSARKFKLLHPDFVRFLRNRVLPSPSMKGRYRNIYRPTTGGIALLTALYTCDQVSAFGFITNNYKNFSDHYFDKTYKRTVFYVNHNFGLEMKLWERLDNEKVMTLFTRNNTATLP